MTAATRPLVSLQQVSSRLKVGSPLPFNVHNAQGKLLLARGLPIEDEQMLASLLERGSGVDEDEWRRVLARGEAFGAAAGSHDFHSRWQALQLRLASLLREPQQRQFLARLCECTQAVANLAERHADQLIFVVMRHDHSRYGSYGSAHSLHVAAVCALVAQRWAWSRERQQRVVGAALTMNLSIIDLQGLLAARGGGLSADQRRAIDRHPEDSAALLRAAGLDDEEWLQAVLQHHEQPGGGGYPGLTKEPGEMSQLLRFVDIFTAKHAGRAGRAPLPAQQAARELYTASSGHPVAAMLIKEFGIYPPGCYVRLANGETAVVVRRGSNANTPLAVAITNGDGDPLATPLRRDTALPAYAIQRTVTEREVRVQVAMERLYAAGTPPASPPPGGGPA